LRNQREQLAGSEVGFVLDGREDQNVGRVNVVLRDDAVHCFDVLDRLVELLQQICVLGNKLTLHSQQVFDEPMFVHDANIDHPSKVVKDLF